LHAKTVSDNSTISNKTKHVNKFVDYSGIKARGSANYSATSGVCANLYCHSDGKGAYKSLASLGWNSAGTINNDCKGCHGSDASPAFTSVAGEPNYASQGVAVARSNSHQKHVDVAADCVKCHAKTTTTGNTIISGSTDHLDRTLDARLSKTSSFTTFSVSTTTPPRPVRASETDRKAEWLPFCDSDIEAEMSGRLDRGTHDRVCHCHRE